MRPLTAAEVAFTAAVDVVHPVDNVRKRMSKPVSSWELSVQLTVTPVEPVGVTVRFEGAAGGPGAAVATSWLGVESPLAFVASTRKT